MPERALLIWNWKTEEQEVRRREIGLYAKRLEPQSEVSASPFVKQPCSFRERFVCQACSYGASSQGSDRPGCNVIAELPCHRLMCHYVADTEPWHSEELRHGAKDDEVRQALSVEG